MTKPCRSYLPEYKHWINMKSRCCAPSSTGYENYGGRGIKVCDRWAKSFDAFYEDMGPRPTPSHSLDRIDVNGDYEPTNCRWATKTSQMRNTRVNRLVTVDGSEMTLAEAAEKAPVPYNTVLYRLKRGWPLDEALRHPARKGARPWLTTKQNEEV